MICGILINMVKIMEFKFHRSPAVPRRIADINPETDIRVRLVGRVSDKRDNSIFLKDDSGEVEIIMEPEFASCLSEGEIIRVFTRVLPLETGYELRSELIQDMNKLDKELYDKVILKKKAQ